MLSRLITFIRSLIQRHLFPIIFNLEEEYFDILTKDEEIKSRNVLIGTIRNREQLTHNLNSKFYHIPLKEIITDAGVEYIALYQSKTLFHNDDDITGIKYFGKVSKSSIVPRSAITEIPKNSSELYVRFDIEKWQVLDPHIKIWETYPKVFLKTSSFLLNDSHYTNKLSIENAEEYILYSSICDIISDLYDGFVFREYSAIKRGKTIYIKRNNTKVKIRISSFANTPVSVFREFLTKINQKPLDKN